MAKISDEYLVELIKGVAGSDVIPLVELLKDKENVSEFKLAEKMKITVNQVRNMLYRLAENNLVSSTRKKDKKKGWYIYYWTFDHRKAILLLRKIKFDRLGYLKKSLKTLQETNYFVCRDCKLKYNYEHALDLGFLCNNCAKVLQAEDPNVGIRGIQKEIAKLETDLASKELEEPLIIVEEPVVVKKKTAKQISDKAKIKADKVKAKKKEMRKPAKKIKKAKKTKAIKKVKAKKAKKKPKTLKKSYKPLKKDDFQAKRGFVRRLFSRKH